ncbi:hypothetical protein PAPHI01_2151 [Pancytospora philotis]|nr:hypothetical protein PAPHI01_2151 [Pancytospora philotis]
MFLESTGELAELDIQRCLDKILTGIKWEAEYSHIEIALGQLLYVLEPKYRASIGALHAVIFTALPDELLWSSDAGAGTYRALARKLDSLGVASCGYSISFGRGVRKISHRGRVPIYQRKTRKLLCFIHHPSFTHDIRIDLVGATEEANPDRSKDSYTMRQEKEAFTAAFSLSKDQPQNFLHTLAPDSAAFDAFDLPAYVAALERGAAFALRIEKSDMNTEGIHTKSSSGDALYLVHLKYPRALAGSTGEIVQQLQALAQRSC